MFESQIVKSLRSMRPYYREIPQLRKGMLTVTRDTEITCTLCRGARVIAVKSQHSGIVTFKKCLHCRGSGTMSNNQDKYIERK